MSNNPPNPSNPSTNPPTVTTFTTKSQFKASQQAQKQQRLKYLLEQATVYSKFLSSKFIKSQQQQQEQEQEQEESNGNEKSKEDTINAQTANAQATQRVSQPESVSGGVLKPYQLEGLEWLVSLYENGLNGILADEMGLGKTLQCIAFLAFLREKGVHGPFLIAAPLSTLANWAAELEKFAPGVPCLVYHGTKAERAEMRRNHFSNSSGSNGSNSHSGNATTKAKAKAKSTSTSTTTNPSDFPIIITSYEIIMNDKVYLDAFRWKFIIVDEGHRIKNLNCKLIKTLKEFDSANRLLLTGTPLQNNLAELWSLLNFLLPDIFDDLEVFQRWFDESELIDEGEAGGVGENDSASSTHSQERVSIVTNLHNILRPFLLRRLKVDVETDLPPKREYIISCEMSTLQVQYYHAALDRTLGTFVEDQMMSNGGKKGLKNEKNTIMTVKKRRSLTNSASLKKLRAQDDDEDTEDDDEFLAQLAEEADYSFNPDELTTSTSTSTSSALKNLKLQNLFMQLRKVCNHPYLFFHPYDCRTDLLKIDEQLVQSSGKMVILDQLLTALLAGKHRVLIFSQMTGMLDLLGDFLSLRRLEYCRIDGSTSQPDREEELKRFRHPASTIPVFLLSTRAAGLGINLVAADTVIFYDSDWNPQMDMQAQDRVHRIGQNRPVLVYRLVAAGSVEAKILERASSKRKLERVVIHRSKFKGIKQLARSGSGEDVGIEAEDLKAILREEQARASSILSANSSGGSKGRVKRLAEADVERLMDRSAGVFSGEAGDDGQGFVDDSSIRIAKPISNDLNATLASM